MLQARGRPACLAGTLRARGCGALGPRPDTARWPDHGNSVSCNTPLTWVSGKLWVGETWPTCGGQAGARERDVATGAKGAGALRAPLGRRPACSLCQVQPGPLAPSQPPTHPASRYSSEGGGSALCEEERSSAGAKGARVLTLSAPPPMPAPTSPVSEM